MYSGKHTLKRNIIENIKLVLQSTKTKLENEIALLFYCYVQSKKN